MGTPIHYSRLHPGLLARAWRLGNAWRHWRARGGELALQMFAGLGVLALLGAVVGPRLWRRWPELAIALDQYRVPVMVACALAVAAATFRQGLRWRRECERGPWAALPIAPRQHRRAFDRLIVARGVIVIAAIALILTSIAWRAPAYRAVLAVDIGAFALAIAVALGVTRRAIWRVALDTPVPRARHPRAQAWAGLATRLEHPGLLHAVRWQRVAARAQWVGGRAIPFVGLLCLAVPMGTPWRQGIGLIATFIVAVAGQALLTGALTMMPRLALLTQALPLSARVRRGAVSRYPMLVIVAHALLLGLLLRVMGMQAMVAIALASMLALWNALRLAAALAYWHAPEHAKRYLITVGVLCAGLASAQPLLAPLVLLIEIPRQWLRARRTP